MHIDSDTVAKASRLGVLAIRVGFTVLQIQALEGASAQYLVLRSKVKRGMGAEEAQRIVDRARRETFGATVGLMKDAGLLSEDLEKRFKALLKERNWLVHRSRTDNSAALTNDESTAAMLARIDRAEAESRKLLQALVNLSEAYVLESGVSAEAIREATEEVVTGWEVSDAI